jgi:tRNA threonylcarbamoyladenosine biosynthesis protein TsaE
MHIVTIATIPELKVAASEILARMQVKKSAQCIALKGDLGAGKTAFVKELASVLGIAEDITSPTFVIMKSYPIPAHTFLKTLTHIDAYRIESEDEVRILGLNERMQDPTQIICIEWPEHIPNAIPDDALHVALHIEADHTRTMTYA